MPDISHQLIQLRKELGFTQKELANLVGIDQTMISDYERGKFIPTQKTIDKFAKQGILIDLDNSLVSQIKDYSTREGIKEREMKEDISKQIIKLRENLGLNQSSFARKIGVSPTTLCEIESGKREVSNTTLRKIKDMTGISLNSFDSFQEKESGQLISRDNEIGHVRFTFNIENEIFELIYSSYKETRETTHIYTLILNQEYFDFIKFLSIKYPNQARNLEIDNIQKVLLLISNNKINYFYTLKIIGTDMTGIVTFKPSKFEKPDMKEEPIVRTVVEKKEETNPDRDILILCQKIIQIRDLFNELLEQAEAVVQPIADKQLEGKAKKAEPKVVEVVNKAYKREVGTVNYVQVGVLDAKNQLIFNHPNLSESKCKELQQNHWKTYSKGFTYRTVWTYNNGEIKEGNFVDIVPTNKIQEVESSNGKGVIGYVEHKAEIVEVIYYDRFVD
jgi:transcriptional regulator with XRE-family HTH domain